MPSGGIAEMGRLASIAIYKIALSEPCKGEFAILPDNRRRSQTPILASLPAGIPFLSLCTGEGKNRTAAASGSSWRREEVTQRLGREADGNYVCLALCTGRKRWLIPFGEIFVFTIFYSFVYF